MEWRDCRSEKKDGEYKGEWTVRKSSFSSMMEDQQPEDHMRQFLQGGSNE